MLYRGSVLLDEVQCGRDISFPEVRGLVVFLAHRECVQHEVVFTKRHSLSSFVVTRCSAGAHGLFELRVVPSFSLEWNSAQVISQETENLEHGFEW